MFVVTQETLAPALNIVRAGLVKKAAPPIHSHVLMDLRDGRLRLAAACQVLHAQTSLAVAGGNVALAVPGEIVEIVDRLEGRIVFEPRDQALTLRSGGARLRLLCLRAADFPELRVAGASSQSQVNAQELLHALHFVEPALAKQDPRPYLTGVLFHWEKGALTLVACDGLAMAVVRMAVDRPLEAERIVPAKTVSELIRVLRVQDAQQVRVASGDQSVRFDMGRCEIVTRVLDARYPDWSAILRSTAQGGEGHRITLARTRLLDALEHVSLVARQQDRVTLDYAPGRIMVSATDGDQEAEEQIPAETADAGHVALHKAQVHTALASLSGDQVTLCMATPGKPVRFSGEKRSECYIVMPMKQ